MVANVLESETVVDSSFDPQASAVPPAELRRKLPPSERDFEVFEHVVVGGGTTRGAAREFQISQTRLCQVLDRVRPFVERVIAARKKPWLLAQMFGWSIVMKFASSRLSIDEIVDKATEVVGIPVRPVVIDRPELALDVDVGRPENLEAIRRELEGRAPVPGES